MATTRKVYAQHIEIGDVIPHNARSRHIVEWTVISVLRDNEHTTYTVQNLGNGMTCSITARADEVVHILA